VGNRRGISASSHDDQSHYAGCCTRGNGGKQIVIGAAVLVAAAVVVSTTGTVRPTTVTPPRTPAPPSQHDRRQHGAAAASAPFPSWNRSMLTEIYLCHACSYHEIEDGNGAPGHLPENAAALIYAGADLQLIKGGGCARSRGGSSCPDLETLEGFTTVSVFIAPFCRPLRQQTPRLRTDTDSGVITAPQLTTHGRTGCLRPGVQPPCGTAAVASFLAVDVTEIYLCVASALVKENIETQRSARTVPAGWWRCPTAWPTPPPPRWRRRCPTCIGAHGMTMMVRRPLRPFWRPFSLRFTYVTSVLIKKY
jgi:hypothetical protein